MFGGGPEVRSTWMEFPVLLHEISMMKMEDERKGREKRMKTNEKKKNLTKIAWFQIPDIEF